METVYKINDESWDDTSYAAYYDTESYYGNDDESILGDLGSAIRSGVSAVGNLLTGNPGGAVKNVGSAIGSVLGVNPVPAVTQGIQTASNLTGQITTVGGKSVPFRLPENTATKQDINILQGAIQRLNSEIKKVADTTTNNGQALTRLSKEVTQVDEKHTLATKKQNELIAKLGISNEKLQKAVDSLKNQSQMSMLLPMLMQPSLENITFAKKGDGTESVTADGTTAYTVSSKSSSDNSMLFMMMAMQGSNGGGFGDMANNPMMMYVMFEAMKD